MKQLGIALGVALFLVAGAVLAEEKKIENPFLTAKVGDYISYKMSTKVMNNGIEATMKQTVTAKTDKEVTLKTVATVMGMEAPAQETKIDLTKSYDPATVATQGNKGAKYTKLGEGKETLKIGGKEYACSWTKAKVTVEANKMKFESEFKMWTCKKVPLTGMVKMEMKSQFADVTMELTGSGNEK
jgi:hypothetical protein